MTTQCEACKNRPATVFDGRTQLCATCSRTRSATGALPFLGAALAAAGLIAGGVLLYENRDEIKGKLNLPLTPGTPTLANFSRDLTALARDKKLDPVVGRDEEIERIVAILARRSKNNPVLVGEPGVGKTAIVEGLAQRIVAAKVPASLLNKRVLSLTLGPLIAGTKYRGEFESRVKRILDEVKRSARDVVLFIDELHTLVGAGAAEGAPLDLSSMIKPE